MVTTIVFEIVLQYQLCFMLYFLRWNQKWMILLG